MGTDNNVQRYIGLATQWMVLLLLCLWGGIKADSYFRWTLPICTILFPLTALVVSLVKIIQEFSNKK
jgi:hypothetical protein